MLQHALLYFIPSRKEFLKIQPGTGDNLSPEDIDEGYTDYVLWNRFIPECLDCDGELEMECLDSGMVMYKADADLRQHDAGEGPSTALGDLVKGVLEQAYGDREIGVILLLEE